jgi:Raf kinase inhibitor-like YbhB/YbcL family protein
MEPLLSLTVCVAALAAGSPIPAPYAGPRDTVSPPVEWKGLPAATRSVALLCDDPDAPAGDWVHWVLFNLPADTTSLPARLPRSDRLPNGAVQGLNDYDRAGYDGPWPPPGKPHRYFFKVYALDTKLDLGPGTRKADLLRAMKGHVLAEGSWFGTFQRR